MSHKFPTKTTSKSKSDLAARIVASSRYRVTSHDRQEKKFDVSSDPCLKTVDWLKPLDLSKVKTKNNRDLVACAFPRLAQIQVRSASSSDWCSEFSLTVLIGQTIRRF